MFRDQSKKRKGQNQCYGSIAHCCVENSLKYCSLFPVENLGDTSIGSAYQHNSKLFWCTVCTVFVKDTLHILCIPRLNRKLNFGPPCLAFTLKQLIRAFFREYGPSNCVRFSIVQFVPCEDGKGFRSFFELCGLETTTLETSGDPQSEIMEHSRDSPS